MLPSCPRSDASGFDGSLMSMIWNPLSSIAETIAYVFPPCTNVVTSSPPPSIENALRLEPSTSAIDATRTGLAGSVTSIICTPSSSRPLSSGGASDATIAYVLPFTDAMPTADAPASRSKSGPSTADEATVGE